MEARVDPGNIGVVFACQKNELCVVCVRNLEKEKEMAYVIADPCIGTKDRACVEVCPVACFYENEDQLFIHPQECIDCDACVPVCPVTAIFPEAQVPEEWKYYIQKGIDYFAENAGVPAAKSKAEVGSGGVAEGSTHWVWKGEAAVAAKAPAALATGAAKAEAPPQPTPSPVAAAHAVVAAATEAPIAPPPPAASPVKPLPKPAAAAAPPPKPMDPDEYRRIQALLYQALEMLGGSRPFDVTVFSEAEATGARLKKEVAAEFGKEVYTISELEKKGIILRQKHDLAQSLDKAVDRAQFIIQFRVKRGALKQTAAGGAVTALISAFSGVLSLQTVRTDSLFTSPNPGLLELLRSFLNSESLIPFLSFQMIAGLFGLFSLFAIYQCWKVSKELHELKRVIQAKQMDPRLIARLA